MSSPFDFYNSRIDAGEIVARYEDPDRAARAGHKVNFFGVAIPNGCIPHQIVDEVPDVEDAPIPANWHADTAEFAAALRAIDLAKDTFTMIELGCCWGCWMNITGVSAKRHGLQVKVIGVEGDEGHLNHARNALSLNGFSSDEVVLRHGIAHAKNGFALFPVRPEGVDNWGLEPLFDCPDDKRKELVESGHYVESPMIALGDLAEGNSKIDLLHVDIQGGESALVRDCLPVLSEKVAYIVIGTHSRQIEGELLDAFLNAGWQLEIERPAIMELRDSGPFVTVDGVQGWRNPTLAAA